MNRGLVILLVACGAPPAPPTAPPPARVALARRLPDPPRPAGHPREDLIPRALLFGAPAHAEVTLSPDGKQLAWLDASRALWTAPAATPDQATQAAAGPVAGCAWTFGNQLLHVAGGHVLRGTTDLGPGTAIVKLSAQQPGAVVIAQGDEVVRIELATGKRTPLAAGATGYVVGDDLAVHVARRALPEGGSELVVPDAKQTWKRLDTIAPEDDLATAVLAVAPGGKLYATDSRGRDTAALVALDVATRKATVIAEDAHADAGEVLIHPTRRTVQAVGFTADRLHWKVIDAQVQKDLDALARLDGGDVRIASRSQDDRTWLAVTESPEHPARYYVWDRAKQTGRLVLAARPELDGQPLVGTAPVTIHTGDGLDLVGYLSLPRGVEGRPVPLVLVVHGGPWARDTWSYDPVRQLLANRGYAVLGVNFRGSTGLGKALLDGGNLEWGKAMQQDLTDAVAWAVDQNLAPRDKVAIAGAGYGGYATLAGLATTPDIFACGVDLSGPANLATLRATLPAALAKRRLGDNDSDEGKALLVAGSPITHARHIRRPLLIGRRPSDAQVTDAESAQIVVAMQAHHLPVTSVVLGDARVNGFYAAAEAFLSAHLGGDYQPVTAAERATLEPRSGIDQIPGF